MSIQFRQERAIWRDATVSRDSNPRSFVIFPYVSRRCCHDAAKFLVTLTVSRYSAALTKLPSSAASGILHGCHGASPGQAGLRAPQPGLVPVPGQLRWVALPGPGSVAATAAAPRLRSSGIYDSRAFPSTPAWKNRYPPPRHCFQRHPGNAFPVIPVHAGIHGFQYPARSVFDRRILHCLGILIQPEHKQFITYGEYHRTDEQTNDTRQNHTTDGAEQYDEHWDIQAPPQ